MPLYGVQAHQYDENIEESQDVDVRLYVKPQLSTAELNALVRIYNDARDADLIDERQEFYHSFQMAPRRIVGFIWSTFTPAGKIYKNWKTPAYALQVTYPDKDKVHIRLESLDLKPRWPEFHLTHVGPPDVARPPKENPVELEFTITEDCWRWVRTGLEPDQPGTSSSYDQLNKAFESILEKASNDHESGGEFGTTLSEKLLELYEHQPIERTTLTMSPR